MSASKNADAVANQDGQFGSRVPGSEPLESSGHKPGVLASEKDRAPEFHAQTLPPGTAPSEATYEPNPDLNNQRMYQAASTTIGGATTADVHTGLGHPGQDQTSAELRHDGQRGGSKQGTGVSRFGEQGNDPNDIKYLERDPTHAAQRNLGEVPSGQRGTTGGPAAEERFPEGAETVASEHKLGR
ncbi:hypothetical protein CC78DRAFT_586083 [Lojkania enalia]|uniref:Uncharacterized protein n=1 Tax=Lojkania enalia TaxID=147567 RepID=A0A9P4MVS5_9PLEO|nr:hypothetical protein CC78DRAFT_586083 [Didymosphaeria enalia]